MQSLSGAELFIGGLLKLQDRKVKKKLK